MKQEIENITKQLNEISKNNLEFLNFLQQNKDSTDTASIINKSIEYAVNNNSATFKIVSGYGLTIEMMQAPQVFDLVEKLKHSKVTEINISSDVISGKVMTTLAEALKNSEVTSLCFRNNSISDEGMIALAEVLKDSSKVTRLDLFNNEISDKGMVALAKGLKVSKVTALDLSHSKISDEGMIALAEVLNDSNVTDLCIAHNIKGERMVALLTKGLKVSKVTALNLSHNKISDEGMIALAEVLKDCTRLDLSNNEISDKGMIALAEVLNGSKVTALNLSHNKISDEGIIALAKGLKGCTSLDLSNNKISDEGAIALEKGLWDSKVTAFNIDDNDDISKDVIDNLYNPVSRNVESNRKIANILWKYITKDEDDKEESKEELEPTLVFNFEKLVANKEELKSLLKILNTILEGSINLADVARFSGSELTKKQILKFGNDKAFLLEVKGKIDSLLSNSSSSVAQQEELSELGGMMISDEQQIQSNQQEVEAQVMGDSSELQNQDI